MNAILTLNSTVDINQVVNELEKHNFKIVSKLDILNIVVIEAQVKDFPVIRSIVGVLSVEKETTEYKN